MVAKETCPSETLTNWSNSHISLSYLVHEALKLSSTPLPPSPCLSYHLQGGLCYQAPSLAENKGAPPSPPANCEEATSKLAKLPKPWSLPSAKQGCGWDFVGLYKDCETGGWKRRVTVTCPEGQHPALVDGAGCSSSQLTLVAE